MPGYALLAPIPSRHLEGAIEVLKKKDFVLFGSEAFDVFKKTEVGSKVLIYVSHENAEPVVSYSAVYRGIVGDPMAMRQLEKEGYRPTSTTGERWGFYWKVSEIKKLSNPIPLSDIQLVSGNYLNSYPRGPQQIVS
jgi:predicted RNA-binding protein with PUA-like domain